MVKLVDADLRQMEDAIMAFGQRLRHGGVGLFYFAGHGVQVDGVNYLIPIGARIESEGDVQYESVNANRVLSKMQDAGNPLNMVFLDACRNNPFARKFRSLSKGLAPMDAPKGSLVVYATAAGDVAEDGNGRNGIFTKNLLREMQKPGLEVGPMIRRVRAGVLKDTGDRQLPFEVSCLTGSFYFNPARDSGTSNYSVLTTSPEPKARPLPGESAATLDDLIGGPEKGGVGGIAGKRIGDYMDQQERALRNAFAAIEAASIQRSQDVLTATFKGDFMFDTNSAALKLKAYPEIDKVTTVLAQYPQTRITIEGHTDTRGDQGYNQQLSARRAEAVKNALLQRGVDPARMQTIGYGETRPISSYNALNRRVVIVITPLQA